MRLLYNIPYYIFFLNLGKIIISSFYLNFYSHLSYSVPTFGFKAALLALSLYIKCFNFGNLE